MLERQTTGSVVCPSCQRLVGVNDERCHNCGRINPGMWGFTPLLRRLGQDLGLAAIVIAGSTVLFLAALAFSPAEINLKGLFGFLAPGPRSVFLLGASGPLPVFGYGRWWTLLSASWLHGSLLHILFNMLWIRQLAPAVGHLYGPGRATLIYVLSGVTGFAASTGSVYLPALPLMGNTQRMTLGASAALFGLLGALVHFSRRGGNRALGQQVWSWAIALFVFGLVMEGVDNWAHLGGFLGGWGLSYLFDPLKPERMDHILAALVALGLSAAAVIASVVTGLPHVRGG